MQAAIQGAAARAGRMRARHIKIRHQPWLPRGCMHVTRYSHIAHTSMLETKSLLAAHLQVASMTAKGGCGKPRQETAAAACRRS